MALIGRFQNPYRKEEVIESAYLRVNPEYRDYSDGESIEFSYSIFYSKEDRVANSPAIKSGGFQVLEEDYLKFFSEDILKQAGKSIKTQIYEYLKSLDQFSDWQDA